ncbi:hypothetical protein PRZ48_014153 [Zasmidium cellare]|uniref:Uncharacterized protein n=1 Tax=Zasmidium cellare TaxID=395010 RepID=A0ABR0E054_ZASCE|nr:hypothetical protein PRZ48_014153 [Zasmidium cellare]
MATFDQRVQNLPTELFDEIFALVFTLDEEPSTTLTKDYKPPARLQVDRASRADFATTYYSNTIFDLPPARHDDETFGRFLKSLPAAHRVLIRNIHTTSYGHDSNDAYRRCGHIHRLGGDFDTVNRHFRRDFLRWKGRCLNTTLKKQGIARADETIVHEEAKLTVTFMLMEEDGPVVEAIGVNPFRAGDGTKGHVNDQRIMATQRSNRIDLYPRRSAPRGTQHLIVSSL